MWDAEFTHNKGQHSTIYFGLYFLSLVNGVSFRASEAMQTKHNSKQLEGRAQYRNGSTPSTKAQANSTWYKESIKIVTQGGAWPKFTHICNNLNQEIYIYVNIYVLYDKNAKKIYNLKSITGIASEWVNEVYIYVHARNKNTICVVIYT